MKKLTKDEMRNLGSWLTVAEEVSGKFLTLMRFGDGWKAIFGVYDWDTHYAYLFTCKGASTQEIAAATSSFGRAC